MYALRSNRFVRQPNSSQRNLRELIYRDVLSFERKHCHCVTPANSKERLHVYVLYFVINLHYESIYQELYRIKRIRTSITRIKSAACSRHLLHHNHDIFLSISVYFLSHSLLITCELSRSSSRPDSEGCYLIFVLKTWH